MIGWLFNFSTGHKSNCSSLKALLASRPSRCSQRDALFALGVLKLARLRKRKSPKVSELMTRPEHLSVTGPEAAVIDWLLKASSEDSERLGADRLEDAIGVLAINGVRVRRSRLGDSMGVTLRWKSRKNPWPWIFFDRILYVIMVLCNKVCPWSRCI